MDYSFLLILLFYLKASSKLLCAANSRRLPICGFHPDKGTASRSKDQLALSVYVYLILKVALKST